MNHTAYTNFFKSKASSHYLLRHDKPASVPSGNRVSFFRMNEGRELQQAIPVQVDYPCLLLPAYRGKLSDNNDGHINDVITGFFEIRQLVNNPLDFEELENAQELCKQIGLDIIAGMVREVEEMGNCGVLGFFDANSVQYDFTGPSNINEYGCLFLFELRDEAFNSITQDLDEIFL